MPAHMAKNKMHILCSGGGDFSVLPIKQEHAEEKITYLAAP